MSPPKAAQILRDKGFEQSCDEATGRLLAVLASSKPNGNLLELGTGVGHSTAWLLAGMDAASMLTSLDVEAEQQQIARDVLGDDPRLRLVLQDGEVFLDKTEEKFDLIFADAWPGKFDRREQALNLLKPGGLYLIDDLNLQPHWPSDHPAKVKALVKSIESTSGLRTVRLDCSTGLMLLSRTV